MDATIIDPLSRPFDHAKAARRDAGAVGGGFSDALAAQRDAAVEPARRPVPERRPDEVERKPRPAGETDAPRDTRQATDEAVPDEAPPSDVREADAVAAPVEPSGPAAQAQPATGGKVVEAAATDGAAPAVTKAAATAAPETPAAPAQTAADVPDMAAAGSSADDGPPQAPGGAQSGAGPASPATAAPGGAIAGTAAAAAPAVPSPTQQARGGNAAEPSPAGDGAARGSLQATAAPGPTKGGQNAFSDGQGQGQGQSQGQEQPSGQQAQASVHAASPAPIQLADMMPELPDATGFARAFSGGERADGQPIILAGVQPAGPTSTLLSTTSLIAATHAGHLPAPAAEQIALRVQKAVADGSDRISMSLKPADLGRVDVQLDVGPDGRVQATVSVDRPDTLTLLQRDARSLEQALLNAGLQADGGSLNFTLRQEAQDHDGGGSGGFGGGDGRGPAEDEPPPPPRRVSVGGIDLKV